jgi:hypothetical protein
LATSATGTPSRVATALAGDLTATGGAAPIATGVDPVEGIASLLDLDSLRLVQALQHLAVLRLGRPFLGILRPGAAQVGLDLREPLGQLSETLVQLLTKFAGIHCWLFSGARRFRLNRNAAISPLGCKESAVRASW